MSKGLPDHLTGPPGRSEMTDSVESFERDLHGDDRAGQHAGVNEFRAYTAYDVKELHERMLDFGKDELKRIPVLAHGERLEQGGIYLDLSEKNPQPFTAQGSQEAQDPHLYVPKAALDYELWNKLMAWIQGSL